MEFTIDRPTFIRRLRSVTAMLFETKDEMKTDALAVCVGNIGSQEYNKSLAMQLYLFSFEFPNTFMLFTRGHLIIVSSQKKNDILRQNLMTSVPETDLPLLVFIDRPASNAAAQDNEILLGIRDNYLSFLPTVKLGHLPNDEFAGQLIESWKIFLEALGDSSNANPKITLINAESVLSKALAPKEEEEIIIMKRASRFSCELMEKYIRESLLEDHIESMDAANDMDGASSCTITHAKLTEAVERVIANPALGQIQTQVNTDYLQACYPPIIQSGKSIQLDPMPASDDNRLAPKITVCVLGIRYKGYCTNLARTYLVNATAQIEQNYHFLNELRTLVLTSKVVVSNAPISSIYGQCLAHIKDKRPDLEPHFLAHVGHTIGLEFRDNNMVLDSENKELLIDSSTVVLSLGFQNLQQGNNPYGLYISDTIRIGLEQLDVLTIKSKTNYEDVSYTFDEEEVATIGNNDDPAKISQSNLAKTTTHATKSTSIDLSRQSNSNKSSREALESSSIRTNKRLRENQPEILNAEKRRMDQRKLLQIINKEAYERLKNKDNEETGMKMDIRNYTSYRNAKLIPFDDKMHQSGKILIDRKTYTVLLPIFNRSVPFHISMIRAINFSDQQDFGSLRVNFQVPSMVGGQPNIQSTFAPADSEVLRELTFKSNDKIHLKDTETAFKDLQKSFKIIEAEKKQKEGLVQQDALVLSKGRMVHHLNDINVRPSMAKKTYGVLELHENGLCFKTNKNERVDLLFNNIKYAFFQPCDGEISVLIHFHLVNPIMGPYKTKQKDIQFYTEVAEAVTDLNDKRYRQDRDEIEAEYRERQNRRRLNKIFQSFCEKIEEHCDAQSINFCKFDQPFRKLGFTGVPNRQRGQCFLMPTTDCLISLTEMPFVVYPLENVELVHFERVDFANKEFDMVFVYKSYTQKPTRIDAINRKFLETIKDWLNSCSMKYSEGKVNLDWNQLMKHIVQNPDDFFEEGGWAILDLQEALTDEEDEDEMDEGDEAFTVSESDLEDDDSDSSDIESDEDEDGSSASGEYSDSSGGDSDESEGKSWSELEEDAKNEDTRRKRYDSEDEGLAKRGNSQHRNKSNNQGKRPGSSTSSSQHNKRQRR